MVLVMDTWLGTSGVPLIVAVSMKSHFVTHFFSPSLASWSEMVDFNVVLVFEEESTPTALSLLFLE